MGGSLTISTEYRGEKVVFSPVQKYYPLLDTYVTEYEGPNNEGKIVKYYGYDDIEVVTPNLIQDFVTNGDFKSGTDGWKSSVVIDNDIKPDGYKKEDCLPTYENIAYRLDGDKLITLEQDYFGGNFDEDRVYTSGLLVNFKKAVSNWDENKLPFGILPYGIMINSGLYDSRLNLCKTNFVNGSKFRVECEYKIVSKNTVNDIDEYSIQSVTGALGLYIVSYDENKDATVTGHDTALSGQNMKWTPTILAGMRDEQGNIKKIELDGATNRTDIEIINLPNSSDEWIKNSHIRIFLVNEGSDALVLINKFRIYPLVKNDNGETITPETQTVEASVRTNKVIFPV